MAQAYDFWGGGPPAQVSLFSDYAVEPEPAAEPGAGEPVVYRSGMTSPADFRGGMLAGVPVGVQIGDVSDTTADMILAYNHRGGRIFFDTGEFTAFKQAAKAGREGEPGPRVDFDEVFRRYDSIVRPLWHPERVALMMPDRIGDQRGTLDLLRKYRTRVRRYVERKYDVMVAIQKGELSLAEAYRETVRVLGTDNFRVSFPAAERAVTADELIEFFSEVRPRRAHLLGIARQRRFKQLVELLRRASPDTGLASDANHLRAVVGKGRKLTEAVEDRVWREAADVAYDGSAEYGVQDYTESYYDHYNTPAFLTRAQSRRLAEQLTRGMRKEAERAAMMKLIVEAALDPRPAEYREDLDLEGDGHGCGSRLGQVLEEFYPEQIGWHQLDIFLVEEARRSMRPHVRSQEIARIERGRGGARLAPDGGRQLSGRRATSAGRRAA